MKVLGSRYIDRLFTTERIDDKEWDRMDPSEQRQIERLFKMQHPTDTNYFILKPHNQL